MKKLLITTVLALGLATASFAGMEDDPLNYKFTMDRLEVQDQSHHPVVWEADLWVGKDLNKIYLITEEEVVSGDVESENQLLYSRAISPFWDVQLGIGYDKTPEAHQTWGVIALQGLAPYFFETKLDLLINNEGTLGLRFETEYEALLTQKLILSPRLETDLYTANIEEMGIGSGLSSLNLGLRLRYEFVREFAPYVGVEWDKTFGNTADYNDVNEVRTLIGLRFWF